MVLVLRALSILKCELGVTDAITLAKHLKLDVQSCLSNLSGDADSTASFVILLLCFSASWKCKGRRVFAVQIQRSLP